MPSSFIAPAKARLVAASCSCSALPKPAPFLNSSGVTMAVNSLCQVPPLGRTKAATSSGSPQNFQMSTCWVTLVRNVGASGCSAMSRSGVSVLRRRLMRARAGEDSSAGGGGAGDVWAGSAPALSGAGVACAATLAGMASATARSAAYRAHCCSDDGPAGPAGADATAMCADVSRGAGRRTSPARDGPLPSPCAGCAPCGRP